MSNDNYPPGITDDDIDRQYGDEDEQVEDDYPYLDDEPDLEQDC